MVDKLKVDLEVTGAAKSAAAINTFKTAVVDADRELNKLGTPNLTGLDKQMAGLQRRTLSLAFDLKQLSTATIGTAGVDGLGKAAARAETQIRASYARLRELDALAATSRDPVVLRNIRREAGAVSAELDKLQLKMNRVAAGRAAAADRRGAGSNVDGRGLLGSASAAGVPYAFEASLGLDAAAAAGISTASLVAFGAIAAAGVGLVMLSEKIRAEAERRLKVEENIAIAANKQIIAGQKALADLKTARAEAEFNRQFQGEIETSSIERLKQRRDLLIQIFNLSPTGPNADKNAGNIAALDNAIAGRDKSNPAAADAAFNQRNEQFKADQRRAAEREKERLESVRAGQEKIQELGERTDELFRGLYSRAGSSNPFVAVFDAARDSIEKTRIATAALSADLQVQALQMVQTSNANALFTTRIDAALTASDLRADAGSFRGGRDTKTADQIATAKIKQYRDEMAGGLYRNPQNLALFGSGTSAKTGLELFDFQRQLEQSGGLFRNPAFDAERRRQIAESNPGEITVQEKLDRQLAALRSVTPGNDQQKAEAERRLIAITAGLNPSDLSNAQRSAAADARENEAIRVENAEKDARVNRQNQLDTQKNIDKNISDLLQIAKKDGLTGVIRIINDAEGSARAGLGSRPRAGEGDARQLMEQ